MAKHNVNTIFGRLIYFRNEFCVAGLICHRHASAYASNVEDIYSNTVIKFSISTGTICLTMYIKGKKKKKQDWSTGINVFKKVPKLSTKLELSNIHVITNTNEWDKVSEQLNAAVQQFPVSYDLFIRFENAS